MKEFAKRSMAILAVFVLVMAIFVTVTAYASPIDNKTTGTATVNIYGYIQSNTGAQIVGLTVSLFDIYSNRILQNDSTKLGGFYQFNYIKPGYYNLRIYSQDINNNVYFESKTDTMSSWNPRLEAGDVRVQNFTIFEQPINAHMKGKVTDGTNPAIGAIVTLTDPIHNYVNTTKTASDGTYDMDFYAGNFTVDITGTGSMDKYSYSGPVMLTGDGERNVTLKHSQVVQNYLNSKVQAVVYVNGVNLTEGTQYILDYPTGNITFYDSLNSVYLYNLHNRDVLTAKYHYLTGPWTPPPETLTSSWNYNQMQLNFSYGNIIMSSLHVKKDNVAWPQLNNYTLDLANGVLNILPSAFNISLGDQISAWYSTTEKASANSESVLVSGENIRNFAISKYWIEGYAINNTYEPITGVISTTLYDLNTTKIYTTSTVGGTNYFTISVPASIKNDYFIATIHSLGYNPYTMMNFQPTFVNGKCDLKTLYFTKSAKELFQNTIAFNNTKDWNNITITTSNTWNAGSSFPGIGNETIGNMRMQIDLKFGNGDGILQPSELQAFQDWLEKITPNYVSTNQFITLNDSAYNSSTTNPVNHVISVNDTAGDNAPVDSTQPIIIKTLVKATVAPPMKFKSPKYVIKLTANYDTATRNNTYSIELPQYYVRTSKNMQPDQVLMGGYTNISMYPAEVDTGGATVINITVQKAINATAVAKILTWNGNNPIDNATNAYLVPKVNNTYIVAYNKNVTFSGEDSIPSVGDIIGYNWDFGDGSTSGWSQNVTAVHKYTSTHNPVNGTVNFTAALFVKNSLGNVTVTNATDNLTVRVDKVGPTAIFDTHIANAIVGTLSYGVKRQNVTKEQGLVPVDYTPIDKTIITWVGRPIIFNASSSFASLLDSAKKDGTIKNYRYDFGNSNTSKNLTSSYNYTFLGYSKAGMYNVTLNVTDIVSLWMTAKLTVVVKSNPGFWIWGASQKTNVTTLVEKTKYVFVANVSEGPFRDTIKNYNWTFSFPDDTSMTTTLTGNVISYTFPKNGQWNVTLNTTDLLGNYAVNASKYVVTPGPHPDIAIMNINFSVDTPEEGQEVKISVNISNLYTGNSANATNIVVSVYDDTNKNGLPDSGELIAKAVMFNGTAYANNVYPNLMPDHWVIATVNWNPEGTYQHLIIANVTCNNELANTMYNNQKNMTVYVNPAKWKTYALVAGTIVVIVVAIILIYAWKTGRFSNFRRRRKERLDTELAKGKETKDKIDKNPKNAKK